MEKFSKNNKEVEIDPSKSSFFENNLFLEKSSIVENPSIFNGAFSEREVYIDKMTGEEFFSINDNKRPEFQRFVSYILKGVVNTADIIKYNGHYFSHRQKLKNVENKGDFFLEEIKADIFILKNIFGDYDHNYYNTEDLEFQGFIRQKNITEDIISNVDTEHRNIVVNENNKNNYFFDLERAGYIGLGKGEGFHSLQIKSDKNKSEYRKFLIDDIYSPKNNSQKFNIKTIEILKTKVNFLIEDIFSEENYLLFKKIVEKSETHFDETTFDFYSFNSNNLEEKTEEIFYDLCIRCKIVKDLIQEIIQVQNN